MNSWLILLFLQSLTKSDDAIQMNGKCPRKANCGYRSSNFTIICELMWCDCFWVCSCLWMLQLRQVMETISHTGLELFWSCCKKALKTRLSHGFAVMESDESWAWSFVVTLQSFSATLATVVIDLLMCSSGREVSVVVQRAADLQWWDAQGS